MSSHQNPYNYPDASPMHHESGSAPHIVRRSQSPGSSWIPSVTTGDQSGHSQSHQSLDHVGNLLEAHDAEVCLCHNFDNTAIYSPPLYDLEDMSYSFNPPYFPQGTSFQDPGAATDATYNDDIHFYFTNLPFYSYHDFDYRQSQHQSSYPLYEPSHDFPGQPFIHNAHPMSDLTHSFSVYPAQAIHAPQTSQGPPAPVYPSSSSTQLPSLDCGRPVYERDSRSARPNPGSLTPDGVNTASTVLPNADAGRHSHPSPVATSPSNQNSAPGPSRPSPSSPERKRLLPLSADEELSTGRRVVPRSDRAWSVHSTSSDSHMRNRSTDYFGRGPLIPQDRYRTSGISTYTTAEHHPHITFDLENPNQTGIPITDILNRTDGFDRIRDRTQAFSHMGKKTFTLRVQWPGYKPWSKTIAALDWKKLRAPITRVKLAEAVATAIRDLIQKKRDEPCDPDYAQWNVGPNGIQLDQLCLVALYHVSRGSWQPQLCLLEPRR